MEWTWLLVLVGLMFVMHRFGMGCCGGHGHGHHKDEGDKALPSQLEHEAKNEGENSLPVTAKSGDQRA